MSCPKSNLEKSSITDDLIPLMTFADFNQAGSKYKVCSYNIYTPVKW